MSWPPSAPSSDDLLAIARAALPRFLFQPGTPEVLTSAAVVLARVGQYVDERYLQTLITKSTGIWVDSHLADRGLVRLANESDEAARQRARQISDAVTPVAILAAVNAVLVAAGVTGTSALVELRRDRARVNRSYAGRGFRAGPAEPSWIIVMLPYGTSADVAAGISELVRVYRAGGFPHLIEVRGVP